MTDKENKQVSIPKQFKSELHVAGFFNDIYKKQVQNYFKTERESLEFLTSIRTTIQKNPKLLECTGESVINSFVTLASVQLLPSDISGEAYVIPQKNKGIQEARPQIGYQGFVTLLLRAGVQSIHADIVREYDDISLINGQIQHSVDPLKSNKDRGRAIGAYVVVLNNNAPVGKYMHADDILSYGKRFSKSFNNEYSPWKESNDPELWMWKKTVLKQIVKLLPKNKTLNKAVFHDNQDSIVSDRIANVEKDIKKISMTNYEENDFTQDHEVEEAIIE